MRILKINPRHPEKEKLLEAAKTIREGGVVVYPTETLYGLGANVFDKDAVRKVFTIKSREKHKPLSVAVKNLSDAKKLVKFNPVALKLAKKFLPGPLTLVLPLKDNRLNTVTAGRKTLGIRIPGNKIALSLLKYANVPMTSTSANISGKKSVNMQGMINQVGNKVNLILDAGKCKFGKPSTIVSVIGNEIKILRIGAIPEEEILKI